MSRIKAIIFDLDDTLFDTSGQIKDRALKKAVEVMVSTGLKCSKEEAYSTIKKIIKEDPSKNKFLELAKRYGAGEDLAEIGKKAYCNIDIDSIHLFPGVRHTLKQLKKEYRLALISTGNPELQFKKIEILDIEDYFDHIYINQKDTKEECFMEAIEKLGINANRIMVVGDRIDIDIKAGNKLGLTSIRIKQGSYKELKANSNMEIPDFNIENISEIPDILEHIRINEHKLEQGPKIAVIGGGTGLPTLLEGLKRYTHNLAAVVTITDEGRSSGRLRKELNMLPPGDIRNNLIALSDSEKMMHDLFQYRFEDGSLKGHSFGNLLIAALTKMTGNFETAIRQAGKILNLKGGVYPSTLEDTHICAELEDGTILNNEQEIVIKGENINDVQRPKIKNMFINPEDVQANLSAIERIKEADAIIIGPGSLLTSVVPNLLIKGIRDAIKESNAKKIYVCNIVTQPGQTENFKASDHAKVIIKYLGEDILDYVMLNNKMPPQNMIEEYKKEKADIVMNDIENIKKLRVEVIEDDLLESVKEKKILWEKQYLLRHDSNRIAKLIINKITNGNRNIPE